MKKSLPWRATMHARINKGQLAQTRLPSIYYGRSWSVWLQRFNQVFLQSCSYPLSLAKHVQINVRCFASFSRIKYSVLVVWSEFARSNTVTTYKGYFSECVIWDMGSMEPVV
jgi:hypothetical protein